MMVKGVRLALSFVFGAIIIMMLFNVYLHFCSQNYREVAIIVTSDGINNQEAIDKCSTFVYSMVKELEPKKNMVVECAMCLSDYEECNMVNNIRPKCDVVDNMVVDKFTTARFLESKQNTLQTCSSTLRTLLSISSPFQDP